MTMHTRRILESQHRALADGILSMWTIYDHPSDFPNSYVARRFEVGGGADPAPRATGDILEGELAALRKSFHMAGLVCLTRSDADDANIVETWL